MILIIPNFDLLIERRTIRASNMFHLLFNLIYFFEETVLKLFKIKIPYIYLSLFSWSLPRSLNTPSGYFWYATLGGKLRCKL